MTLPICEKLREFEGSDALGNGDFTLMGRSADLIETLVKALSICVAIAPKQLKDSINLSSQTAFDIANAALALARGENTPGSEEMK